MEKVLLVDKPKTWTSFDIVGKVRSNLYKISGSKIKVGHAGTLDPLATGLLIVLIGKATKIQDSFMKLDKVYEVEVRLGETSTTLDGEGQKTKVSENVPAISIVNNVLESFIGDIMQIPPAYSAIKVDGQRAYKLARAGKEVKIEPRKITIYSITDVIYDYPYLKFTSKVSSGTYIRTLAQDIGEKLGVGAFMSNLRRTKIGGYDIKDAVDIENISFDEIVNQE